VASTIGSKRTRGPNKQTPWARNPEDEVSLLRLALDTSDPLHRAKLEAMFSCAFTIRRALQHDARNRLSAYRAATHERKRKGPSAVRERLGRPTIISTVRLTFVARSRRPS